MTASIFIGVVTILHILGYIALIYWTTHLKAGGNAQEGEIINHTWDSGLKEMNNPLPGWWLSLFYLMIAFGIVYLILYPGIFPGIKHWTQVGQYEQEVRRFDRQTADYLKSYQGKTIEELATMPKALATGRRIFSQNCAVCHASDAGGNPGAYPNLRDNDWIWGGSAQDIVNTITNGHTGAMPPGGALIAYDFNNPNPEFSAQQKEELSQVASYVLSLGGYEHNSALAEKGKALFDRSCFACHGADGKGNQMIGAPNLTDDVWLYAKDDTPEELKKFIEHQIIHPQNNVMPAWKDVLGKEKINLVAAYVYSLSHDKDSTDTQIQ